MKNVRTISTNKSPISKICQTSKWWWLTLSWWRPLPYRNQSMNLQSKSMDWFLDDNGLRHERVKEWTYHLLHHFDITISLEGKKKSGFIVTYDTVKPAWYYFDVVYVFKNCPLPRLLAGNFFFFCKSSKFSLFWYFKNLNCLSFLFNVIKFWRHQWSGKLIV